MTELSEISYMPSKRIYRSYVYFWIGQLFSLFGSAIVQFSLTLWVTLTYQDEIYTSLIFFITFIPPLIITPIAGVYADRLNKKKLILFSDSMQACTTLLIIIFFIIDSMSFYVVLLCSFLRSVFQYIHHPTSTALMPLMVPKEKLSRINGMNYLFLSIINIAAPIIAGILIAIVPFETLLSIDIITFLIALIPLVAMINPTADLDESEQINRISFVAELLEGFKVIKRIPGFITLLSVVTIINFFERPLTSLISNFIIVDNHGTEFIYSLTMGILSFGIFVGSIIVSLKKDWKRKIEVIILGIILENFAYFVIAISPYRWFYSIFIGIFFYGAIFPVVNTLFLTLIQTNIPKDKQGRVFSTLILLGNSVTPISILLGGPFSKLLGISNLWIFCSVFAISASILIWKYTNIQDLKILNRIS